MGTSRNSKRSKVLKPPLDAARNDPLGSVVARTVGFTRRKGKRSTFKSLKIQAIRGIDRNNPKPIPALSENRLFLEVYDTSSCGELVEPCASLLSFDALTHYESIYIVPASLNPNASKAKLVLTR